MHEDLICNPRYRARGGPARTLAFGTRALIRLTAAMLAGCDPVGSSTGEADASSAPEGSPSASAEAATGPPPFSDRTSEAGIAFVHENGMSGEYYFVEIMGGGGALLDYDGDGDLDLYLTQGHLLGPDREPGSERPYLDRLYRNELVGRSSDGSPGLRFTDVTWEAGIRADGYGMGVATGDYDNDGRVDLYVLNWGANQLWRNNGDGTFTDVTEASGTGDPGWSTGATFLDFDRDGWLDLMVVNYTIYTLEGDRPCYAESGRRDYCGPDAYLAAQDRLFRNRGDGSFEDVTLRMGLAEALGPGLGAVATDFDGDGWPDIYVANDRHENHLWMNRGGKRFENRGLMAGAALNAAGYPEASMGVVAADFDADGDDDLFMTHLRGETNTFYVNQGGAVFEDRTRTSRLGGPSRVYTGFGVAPVDYDNDGWLDLYVANGAVTLIPEQVEQGEELPLKQRNQLFRNMGGGHFEEVGPRNDPVLQAAEVSRGVAYGDVDNDGDADLLVANNHGPARLLSNDVGQDRHWLGLRIVEGAPRRTAVGARVALRRNDGRIIWGRVHTDGSYTSAHDPRVRFGLGDDAAPVSVEVHWPDGQVEVWEALAPDLYHELVRGQGRAGEGR